MQFEVDESRNPSPFERLTSFFQSHFRRVKFFSAVTAYIIIMAVLLFFITLGDDEPKIVFKCEDIKLPLEQSLNASNMTQPQPICGTIECNEVSMDIQSYLNEQVDPCDNFYEFACGNLLNNRTVLGTEDSRFSTTQKLVDEQISKLLIEPVQANESEAFKSAKEDYTICMSRMRIHPFKKDAPRWSDCIYVYKIKQPSPQDAIDMGLRYTRKYVNEQLKKSVSEMAEDIRNSFLESLCEIDWIDEETRKEAIRKAQKIEFKIPFPDHESDRFPVDHKNWYKVNAYYFLNENAMYIPSTILHKSFYSDKVPNYVNYARLGSVVGHEISHGFDRTSRYYDLIMNSLTSLFNLEWPQINFQSERNMSERAKCIIDQYGNFTVENTTLSLNSTSTINEDISDNGGVKVAYFAYKKWAMRHGSEDLLPNLKYNQQQLFWISYAQNWCSNHSINYIKEQIKIDKHSPEKFRVIGSISNMPDSTFAQDFKCAKGTNMNPINKCTVR